METPRGDPFQPKQQLWRGTSPSASQVVIVSAFTLAHLISDCDLRSCSPAMSSAWRSGARGALGHARIRRFQLGGERAQKRGSRRGRAALPKRAWSSLSFSTSRLCCLQCFIVSAALLARSACEGGHPTVVAARRLGHGFRRPAAAGRAGRRRNLFSGTCSTSACAGLARLCRLDRVVGVEQLVLQRLHLPWRARAASGSAPCGESRRQHVPCAPSKANMCRRRASLSSIHCGRFAKGMVNVC